MSIIETKLNGKIYKLHCAEEDKVEMYSLFKHIDVLIQQLHHEFGDDMLQLSNDYIFLILLLKKLTINFAENNYNKVTAMNEVNEDDISHNIDNVMDNIIDKLHQLDANLLEIMKLIKVD